MITGFKKEIVPAREYEIETRICDICGEDATQRSPCDVCKKDLCSRHQIDVQRNIQDALYIYSITDPPGRVRDGSESYRCYQTVGFLRPDKQRTILKVKKK